MSEPAEGLEPPPLTTIDLLVTDPAWELHAEDSPTKRLLYEFAGALDKALLAERTLTAQVEKLQRERDDWKHNAESQFAAIAEQVRMRDEALAELARLRPVVEAAQAVHSFLTLFHGMDCGDIHGLGLDGNCDACAAEKRLAAALDALEAQ